MTKDTSVPRSAKTRPMTILAQDPSVLDSRGNPLLTTVDIPAEQLAPGPCGYRIRVIDYDSSTGTLYKPQREDKKFGAYIDPYANKSIDEILEDPKFHQQNVYAIAMRLLGRFEFALGRRVNWQFQAHQLKLVPHAFREPNAFYSRGHEAVMFGYFASRPQKNEAGRKRYPSNRIYTCLSHDIVAHEMTHALLDGVRERFLYPSLPDQAALHEGFSDLIAILSVISVPDLVEAALQTTKQKKSRHGAFTLCDDVEEFGSKSLSQLKNEIDLISPLVSLAEEMGNDLFQSHSTALRESLDIKPNRNALTDPEFQVPHRRGELLVAAILRAMLQIAKRRCLRVGVPDKSHGGSCSIVSVRQVAECFAKSARDFLNICIRGLDYLVPVHVTFNDYLAGILTADFELVGNDSSYEYRQHILDSFREYGIASSSDQESGVLPFASETQWLRSEHTDHHAMMSNPDEMFRFIWENREPLLISDAYYTRVTSVNPTIRVGPDGMTSSETVVEYVQSARLRGGDLCKNGLRRPGAMPSSCGIDLYGGGTLIFDVRGKLKYHVRNHLDNPERQNERIEHLWNLGHVRMPGQSKKHILSSLSNMHEQRLHGHGSNNKMNESWE